MGLKIYKNDVLIVPFYLTNLWKLGQQKSEQCKRLIGRSDDFGWAKWTLQQGGKWKRPVVDWKEEFFPKTGLTQFHFSKWWFDMVDSFFSRDSFPELTSVLYISFQIIATSRDLPPNGGLVREIPFKVGEILSSLGSNLVVVTCWGWTFFDAP